MEIAIQNSKKLKQILEATTDGIWTWNFKTNNFFFSDRYYEMLGYQANEFPPTFENWLKLIHPDDLDKALNAVQKFFDSNLEHYENEFRLKTANGNYVWIHAHGRVVEKDLNGERILMIGNHRDITDRKIAEINLIESEARYRSIMEAMDELTSIVSPDYHIEYINPAMERKIGKQAYGELCYKMIFNFDHPCPWCHLKRTIKGETVETEMIKTRDHKFYFISHSPISHANGTTSKLTVYRDITAIKKLEGRVQQAQKLESIGNLSGGIAHDFNNILFPIIGMAELLLDDLPSHSQEYENTQTILEAGLRGRDLVGQILAFSRQSKQTLSPVRVQKILKEVLKLSRSAIPSYIEITHRIEENCGLVMANSTQIHQVAMNLITNAFHAIEPEIGTITVTLREVKDLPGSLDQTCQYLMLSVADTGKGIPNEILPKIFDPYFTTKEKGKGTGLGLATVYGIVNDHKGQIKVYSEPGKGTVFNIYLPLMKKQAEHNHISLLQELPTGNERILLVDDEEFVVKLEKQILERLGYKVTAHLSSRMALETFEAKPDVFDIIISDMNMPNMTGVQFAHKVKKIKKRLPVIICTGFSERIGAGKAADLGIDGFLMKPVCKSEMAYMVRNVLDLAKDKHDE